MVCGYSYFGSWGLGVLRVGSGLHCLLGFVLVLDGCFFRWLWHIGLYVCCLVSWFGVVLWCWVLLVGFGCFAVVSLCSVVACMGVLADGLLVVCCAG